jgi:hypothetical protein
MAGELPEGYEIEDGMQTAPSRRRLLPGPPPGTKEPPLEFLSPQGETPPQGTTLPHPQAGSAALPEGYEIEDHGTGTADNTGTKTGLIDAGMAGLGDQPILGPLMHKALAGIEAALPIREKFSHAPTFGQRYAEDEARENARTAQAYADRPITANAANLAGGLALPLGILKSGPMGARLLGMTGQTLGGQMARMGLSGAVIGGTDTGLRGGDPIRGAAVGGGLGMAAAPVARGLGAVAGRIGSALTAPLSRAATEQAAQEIGGAGAQTAGGAFTHESLADVASGKYGVLENGSQIHPDKMQNDINGLVSDLQSSNFKPGPDYHGPVFKTIQDLLKTEPIPPGPPMQGPSVPNLGQIPRGPTTRPAPTSFGDIVAAQQRLNEIMRENPGTSMSAAAGKASDGLTNLMETVGPKDVVGGGGNPIKAFADYQDARANYRVSMRARLYDEAIRKAELAADAGTGSLDLNLRNQFKALRNNTNAMRGATPDEKAQLDEFIKGGLTRNIMRQVGKLSPVGHAFPMMGELGAAVAGEPISALSAAVGGHVAKMLSNRMAAGAAARMSSSIRAQAPASAQLQAMASANFSRALAARQNLGRTLRILNAASKAPAIRAPAIAANINEQQP